MKKKAKQWNMLYSADLASFIFNCAQKKHFFGVRAEILLLLGGCDKPPKSKFQIWTTGIVSSDQK